MATNEEKRRAIGTNNEAARRKIGSDMIERRTGRAQVDDINALLNPPRERRTLKQLEPRGGVTGQVGTGNYTAPPATGGGIASPLTERNRPDGRADREYYPDGVAYYSNDYMLAVLIQPLRQLNMIDAEGRDVPFIFRVPRDV